MGAHGRTFDLEILRYSLVCVTCELMNGKYKLKVDLKVDFYNLVKQKVIEPYKYHSDMHSGKLDLLYLHTQKKKKKKNCFT